ncbi:polymerase [Carajas virus]|uniref:RNA-directed RNA polymerase L n=2 Tax=Carajas virus TaxID=239239 RepID=A0A0D3R1M8_9RHAB|nr:polymerase [Carajas virus]AJR28526.1 polymerase [Carajas virus]
MDFLPVEQEEDWGYAEDDFSSSDYLDFEERMTYLNQADYNLNSPLISDDIYYLSRKFHSYGIPPMWNLKEWDGPLEMLKSCQADPIPHDLMHKWFGTWLEDFDHDSAQGIVFLREVDKEASETYDLVDTFLKNWAGKSYPYKAKERYLDQMKIIGPLCQKFLDLHKLTLILNAVGPEELKNLLRTFKGRTRDLSTKDPCTRLRVPSLGPVFICKGWVYIHKHKILMDRNFLLMCKDVIIGRMQTLLSMIGRSDDAFTQQDFFTLVNIYRTGDIILQEKGNLAYDLIKMVEPICNLKLMKLAREYRPLIPPFPHFENHVKNAVDEQSKVSRRIKVLFELIMGIKNVDLVLVIYGSFRHWGHPFIDYFEGLNKLHKQVTMSKEIDTEYANALASDLARIVLTKQFDSVKKWFVDKTKIPSAHPFFKHIMDNTWPTAAQIQDFGDHWHELPLIKCYEIPDLIDPSIIYSDKSHSMNRSEVLGHVRRSPHLPIPSKKVLQTMLDTRATNWVEFLEMVDKHGLEKDDLIIGLKGKERELKLAGRFFSLMSWKLREYFVITEYLIKTHFVPLFKGLTMADDLTSVIKKMLDSSSGQGIDDYSSVCFANHIDYEKWNNHQRKESNGPVFRVMGQFLGYPRLIERTHEFFEKSLIYYNNRPDLMWVNEDTLINRTQQRVCWEGQAGGLEGLRQKGWSILNLLVIQREAKIRNTAVKVLAQGDNQVICTQYKTKKSRDQSELINALDQMVKNNNKIMEEIKKGTSKLGLLINDDETMQSADYLNYGKVPIFRGVIRGLETKRWSRVTCVTNDQIPTCANLMASVSTNALTVAHFASNPINSMIQYNYFGNFSRLLLFMHDPALRRSLYDVQNEIPGLHSKTFKYAMLYLDPSIGGVSGMALSRFLIRAFPDPVTESLSFWKFIHDHTDDEYLKSLSIAFGNPDIAKFRLEHISKLLEDPTSLNISMGMSPSNLLKTEVKKCLIENRTSIRNDIIKDATIYLNQEEAKLKSFLWSINPLFPRFLSEFKSGTFLGVSEGLISLFQNSRTIRNSFKGKYRKELDHLIVKSEISSLKHLGGIHFKLGNGKIWGCSSSQSDLLRYRSWGRKLVGTTIPHPLEMHGAASPKEAPCTLCNCSGLTYISVHCPKGITEVFSRRGPLPAYLGSKTSETTSILQPWEKESKVPIVRRATRLRDAISWFIDPDSTLAQSILDNIKSLTGEEWGGRQHGYKRTGSALHRFSTSRMSNGGFASQSPAALTRLIATTDTMHDYGDKNYDFMFQASLLYAQMTTSISRWGHVGACTDHYHVRCDSCIREIQEIELNTGVQYSPPDVSYVLTKWRNGSGSWGTVTKQLIPKEGNWTVLSPAEQSYQVGRCIGFLYGDLVHKKSHQADDSSLFPLSIQHKVRGRGFLKGLLDGIMRASCCQVIHRRSVATLKRPANAVYGGVIFLIDKLSMSAPFLSLTRTGPIREELENVPHKMPASYPTNNRDLGMTVRNYFKYQCRIIERGQYKSHYPTIWLFSDVLSVDFIGPMSLSSGLMRLLYKNSLSKKDKNELRDLANLSSLLRSGEEWDDIHVKFFSQDLLFCSQEIRHACKFGIIRDKVSLEVDHGWGKEAYGGCTVLPVFYRSQIYKKSLTVPPRIQNPIISGLRLGQLPTGAHYKIRSIIMTLKINYQDFLSCGDGSGGMTACLLRLNPNSRGIFNSLLELDGALMRGSSPEPPSALETLGSQRTRCVNGGTCWEHPSDLSDPNTWKYFIGLKRGLGLQINLITMDMEVRDPVISHKIEANIRAFLYDLLDPEGTLIYKTYGTYLAEEERNILTEVGPLFHTTDLVQTIYSSAQTSEVYCVCRRLKKYADQQHVDWSLLTDGWSRLYAFSVNRLEFQRAQSLRKLDTLQGIPSFFIPDPFVNAETLLQIAGVPTGISHTAVLHGSLHSEQLITLGIFFCALISHHTMNIIRISPVPPSPPSDGSISRMCSAITGILFWVSLVEKDLTLYNSLLSIIQRSFPIRWYKNKEKNGWSQCWGANGDGIPKDTRLNDSMANIGNWIRAMELLCNKTAQMPFSPKLFNRLAAQYDRELTWKKVLAKTGLADLLTGQISQIDRSVANVRSEPSNENSWQD